MKLAVISLCFLGALMLQEAMAFPKPSESDLKTYIMALAELIKEQETCSDPTCSSTDTKVGCLCHKASGELSTCSVGYMAYYSTGCRCNRITQQPTCPSGEALNVGTCTCKTSSGSTTESMPTCPSGTTKSSCNCVEDLGAPKCESNEILTTNDCECATRPACTSGCTLNTSSCTCA